MTAKEFVQSKFPDARSETHRGNGPYGKKYWLVRNGRSTGYMASSNKSESNAWVKPKEFILKNGANN
jgi:hypothetical protein